MPDIQTPHEAAQEWTTLLQQAREHGVSESCQEPHEDPYGDVPPQRYRDWCCETADLADLIAGRDAQIERAARADEREQVMQRAELDWLNATRGASERADGYTWETAPSRPRYITRALTRAALNHATDATREGQ